jgi:molecular chaperone DnaK
VKTAFDKLNQSQSQLGEAIYARAGRRRAADPTVADPATAVPNPEEDVIDAEVVDDEDEKK